VIATVPTTIIGCLLFGLAFAAAAQVQIRSATAQRGTSRVLAVVLLFDVMIVWPVGLYFYLAHRDWVWMYFVDPRHLPLGVGVLVFAGYTVALLGGYGAGYALVRKGHLRSLYAALGGVLLADGAIAALLSSRLLRASTYANYPTNAISILRVRLGYVLPATLVGVLAAFAFAAWQLWEQGRRQLQ
jgi:hypothetical protein